MSDAHNAPDRDDELIDRLVESGLTIEQLDTIATLLLRGIEMGWIHWQLVQKGSKP